MGSFVLGGQRCPSCRRRTCIISTEFFKALESLEVVRCPQTSRRTANRLEGSADMSSLLRVGASDEADTFVVLGVFASTDRHLPAFVHFNASMLLSVVAQTPSTSMLLSETLATPKNDLFLVQVGQLTHSL